MVETKIDPHSSSGAGADLSQARLGPTPSLPLIAELTADLRFMARELPNKIQYYQLLANNPRYGDACAWATGIAANYVAVSTFFDSLPRNGIASDRELAGLINRNPVLPGALLMLVKDLSEAGAEEIRPGIGQRFLELLTPKASPQTPKFEPIRDN